MKRILFLFIFVSGFAQIAPNISDFPTPPLPKIEKSVLAATCLSMVFPGLGHFYLDDSKTAGALAGTAGMELGALYASVHHEQRGSAIFFSSALANTASYGIYAAYRDARSYNGQSGYKYKMPVDQFADLSSAPFRWSVIKKPEVWGGCLGALTIAVCVNYLVFPAKTRFASMDEKDTKIGAWFPIIAFPVGIGEESFFRGFLQPYLCESLGPWGSLAATSLLFGVAHIPNGLLLAEEEQRRYFSFSLPFITGLGVYLGWLTQRTHSLKESVAVHSWYDFALFSAAAIAQSAAIGCPTFSYALSF